MLEPGSTGWRLARQAGDWLDRLETGSTGWRLARQQVLLVIVHCCYLVLESGSTAVTGDWLDGGYKSAALQFFYFERREDTPDRTSNLNRSYL